MRHGCTTPTWLTLRRVVSVVGDFNGRNISNRRFGRMVDVVIGFDARHGNVVVAAVVVVIIIRSG